MTYVLYSSRLIIWKYIPVVVSIPIEAVSNFTNTSSLPLEELKDTALLYALKMQRCEARSEDAFGEE